jgi:broad specificity phosphatase PhoE
MGCPVKDKAYRELMDLFGEDAARVAWMMNGEKSPTPQEAIKLLYPGKVELVPDIAMWKMPEFYGKDEKTHEPIIDKLILSDPNAPVGKGGESFNEMGSRSIKAGMKILDTAPSGSHVVINSSALKFIMLWDKAGRPTGMEKVTAKNYLALHTTPGETIRIDGKNGPVYWSRHGETVQNDQNKLRGPDTTLTEDGKKEADKIGDKYSKDTIPMTYVSPLVRTLQTLDRILIKQPEPKQNVYYSKDFGKGITPVGNSKEWTTETVDKGLSREQTRIEVGKAMREKEDQGFIVQKGLNDGTWMWKPENNYQQKFNNQKNLRYELQSEINRAISGGRKEDNIGTAFSLFTGLEGIRKPGKDVRSTLDEYWKQIQTSGLEYKKPLGEKWESGQEHNVYLGEKGTVIKVRKDLGNHEELETHLRELIVHNKLFPSTEYKLLGYIKTGDDIQPVIQQSAIIDDGIFDKSIVDNVLSQYGFVASGDSTYLNKELGIDLEDMYPRNIKFKDNVPQFIDPMIIIRGKLYHPLEKAPDHIKRSVDTRLDNKVTGFLNKIGVEVQRLSDEGQDFAGMADTINGVIKVVDGKAGINTLPHEATHMFLDLLPQDSKLLSDILRDVKNKEEYDTVYDRYKDDPQYQKDGKVDEEKMAKEAASHIIDDIIVDKHQEKSSMKWWERLWKWIKDLFKGKSLDAYETVAEDVLAGKTGKLSKEKIRKMQEAAEKGEIYYELNSADKKLYEEIKNRPETTEKQKAIIDAMLLDVDTLTDAEKQRIKDLGLRPAPRIELDEDAHQYADPKTGEIYDSTTGKISGKFSPEKQKRFEPNKDAGNTFDKILETVINGGSYDDVMKLDTPMFDSQDLKRDFVADARDMIKSETEDGSFVIAQMITSDPMSLTAGSKDFSSISPAGTERIVDLKTSVRQVFNKNGKVDRDLSKTYTSQWEMNTGSVFNEYMGDSKGNPVLDSNGKFIKRTPKLDANNNPVVKDGKPEYNEPAIKLSKEQQHAIQVGSYARMDELQGIPVVATKTWHINVDLQQREDGSFFIKNYRNEGILYHNIIDNQPYVDHVVPTEVDENNPSKLQKDRPGYDYFKEDSSIDPEDVERLKQQSQKEFNKALDENPDSRRIAKEIVKIIEQREEYIKNLNRSKQEPAIQERTLHALGDMKRDMMVSLKAKKYSSVLNDWMDYTIRQSTITSTYLSDPDNLSDNRFPGVAIQAMKFVQGYSHINSMIDQVHSTQITKFNQSVGAVNKLNKVLDDAKREYFMFSAINADTKYLEDEIEEYTNGNPKDIGMFSRLFAAPSNTSSIPTSLAFREIAKAHYDAIEYWNKFTDNVDTISKPLYAALGIKDAKGDTFDFMTHKDGRFVMRTSPEYRQKVISAKNKLKDSKTGERKEYWMSDTPEAIAFNKQLFDDIADLTNLTRAEEYISPEYDPITGDLFSTGYYDPGEYCEYKPVPIYDEDGNVTGYDDYEKEREKFEKQDPVTGKYKIQFSPDAVKDLRWMKDGDKYFEENDDGTKGRALSENEIRGIASRNYRNKFYYPIEKTVELQFDKGVFTGKVKPADGTDWRVKPQFKEVRDISTNKEELRDSKYLDMMNDSSASGRAKWQFYGDFMNSMDKLLLKLPPEIMQSMRGRIPVQSSSLFSQIIDGDIPQTKMSLLGDQFKKFMNSTYIGERQVDETGNIKNSIPIGDIGSFRNQEKIDKLKSEIEQMDTDWRAIRDTASKSQKDQYKETRGLKSAELRTEQIKTQPYQIEKNLVKAIKEFSMKVATFDAMSKMEDKFLMIREMAALKSAGKELAMTDPNGRSLFRKTLDNAVGLIKGALTGTGGSDGRSNELMRIDDMKEMLLYKSNEYPGSFMGKIERAFITFTAFNLFVVNPPVSFGVSTMMKSIHLREAAVGQFFNLKQFGRATLDANKAIPQYVSNEAIKASGGKAKKFASYLEAWIHKTQAFTKGESDASGAKQLLQLEHYVEWTGVATGAAAIGMNTKIVGKDGTISNAYDVFDQSPDGSLVVKDNYKDAWNKIAFNLHRVMADYQNRFHGAYAALEAASITKYPGGASLMFLHKWVPAMIQNRLGGAMIHSNLGFTEGSYATLAKGINDILHDQGTLSERFQRGYNSMVPKGSIGNPDWKTMSQEEQQKADDKAYEDDPNFKKTDGTTDWKKVERDRDRRKVEFSNMKRNIFDIVYLMIATAGFLYLKSLAEDSKDDTKRWENFLAKTFDRLRKQQLFAMPVVGLEEEYTLLKSPIASLRTMGEFAQALGATFGLVVPPYEENYYSTGVHKGELKAKVKLMKVIPGANLYPWFTELNSPQFYVK